MRVVITICFSAILLSMATLYSKALEPNSPFDEYGNICFEDEKARLDNLAIALQQNPDWIGYVVVYAGSQSCAGEAWYRANRAKKWVVKRGIAANRIILIYAGYQDDVTTRLQPWPISREMGQGMRIRF